MESNISKCIQKNKQLFYLLGKKGTLELLYVFYKLKTKKRFKELHELLNHISTKTLTVRLKELTNAKILEKRSYNTIPPKVEYSLTNKGKSLINAISPLIDWIINKPKNNKPKIKFYATDFEGMLM
ncbi:MAG: winged helix-turn-helix transcriptional regulator [Candidatus Odinarchaeia archaeon]